MEKKENGNITIIAKKTRRSWMQIDCLFIIYMHTQQTTEN
jgi:hypothetical protein